MPLLFYQLTDTTQCEAAKAELQKYVHLPAKQGKLDPVSSFFVMAMCIASVLTAFILLIAENCMRINVTNLRHAAALALVGWYLMLPPENGIILNALAPLAKWQIAGSYDSAAECTRAMRDKQLAESTKVAKSDSQAPEYIQYVADRERALRALCIASDDPRLKGK